MENRIQEEVFQGQSILVVDYSNLSASGVSELIEKAKATIFSSGRKDILLLEKVYGIAINKKMVDALKDYANEINPLVTKYAVVGVDGMSKVVASTLKLLKIIPFQTFEDELKAKEYLIAD